MTAQLRAYQLEALEAIRGAFLRGVWSQVLVLPTGGGKTVVFSQIPNALRDYLEAFPENSRKVLILAHREELLQQAADKMAVANPGLNIGIEMGASRANMLDDIVIASVQTLAAQDGRRLQRISPESVRVIVVDEAHHAPAASYQKVLDYFGCLPPADLLPKRSQANHAPARAAVQAWWQANNPNRLLLGVTATPARGDAIGLEWTFRQVVYQKTMRWMIEQGYLAPPRGFLVETNVVLDQVKVVGGDFNARQLADAINTPERNALTLEAWVERGRDRRTLGFCVDVQHARDMRDTFLGGGVRAEMIDGTMARDDRRDLVRRFRDTDDIEAVFNCEVMTEGTDIPEIGCVIMARPTKSATLYQQMIGRGARLAPNKADYLVLDVVDVSKRHSLIGINDLFGLPFRDMEGRIVTDVLARVDALQQQFPQVDMAGVVDLSELERRVQAIDLWAVRESTAVNAYARLLWIEDSPDRFHVALPAAGDGGGLASGFKVVDRIEIRAAMLGGFQIVRQQSATTEEIGLAEDLAQAFALAERWIEFNRPDAFSMKAKDAPWRTRPASPKQLALLTRLRAPMRPGMTRGEASDMTDQFLARKRG